VTSKIQVLILKLKYWLSILTVYVERAAFISQYYLKKSLFIFRKKAPLLKKEYFGTFPAVHFKKMDRWDFILKFSSEALVLLFALLVAGLNLYHFGGTAKLSFQDKSFIAKFLDYHPNLNNNLYAKNTSIITTVAKETGFFAQAQAQSLQSPETQEADLSAETTENDIVNQQVLIKPNPDSIQSLIAKQIKVYQTKPGDTLGEIAAENGISVQTLMWTNKLSSELIKPGWYLIILPTDGVMHEASSNDTLPDIANKYKADLAKIIAYNGLENAEDIDGGQIIIVPNGTLPQSMLPKAPASSGGSSDKASPGTTAPKIVNNGTGHLFPWGYCTWYVASEVHVPWGGNAKNWLSNARAYGSVITSAPSIGAIVVTTDNSRYGHVALVEKVEDDRFMVSEMNYEAFGKINTRWISNNSRIIRGFILP